MTEEKLTLFKSDIYFQHATNKHVLKQNFQIIMQGDIFTCPCLVDVGQFKPKFVELRNICA